MTNPGDASTSRDSTTSDDGSVPPDAAAGDTTVGDGPSEGAANDGASNDGASSDAQSDGAPTDSGSDADVGAEAGTDAGTEAGTDAGTDAGVSPATLNLDEAFGANTYGGGLNAAGNWVTSGVLVNSNAGTQWFGSGNGSNNTFFNLAFKKTLGGVVANRPYTVSFYVVLPEDAAILPIELADFSVLRIGGPNGTVIWTSTPVPTVPDVWVKWTGTYTPAPSDVGGPFYFEIKFDLPSKHSMGVDGPIGIE